MANWKSYTIKNIITAIRNRDIVLPVIQRRLEWSEHKMELLFDSLFKKNSFGSVICIQEEENQPSLFAYREFTRDGSDISSREEEVISKNMMLIIDGQQRLQSFYMGLDGSYDGKVLYYDLFSDYKASEYDFKFSADTSALPKTNSDRPGELSRCVWYPAVRLFARLEASNDPDQTAEEIAQEYGITDTEQVKCIEKNVRDFYSRIFIDESIGISNVVINKTKNILENRQRVVELFKRLNDGGTKLSSFDLVASTLKGFDYRMESFLDDVTAKNEDIGINQDVLIKLLLVLNDKPTKGMAELSAEDAEFATNNRERIEKTLEILRKFLEASNNEKWFKNTNKSAINRSAIPLYFLAYHIFYQPDIDSMFEKFDTSDINYANMLLWLRLSLLNHVFRYGCGWKPDATGMRKIHAVMTKNKGRTFPANELFSVYRQHPLRFSDASGITADNLDMLDQEYIFYLVYGGTRSYMRNEDKDHIQPRSILEAKGIDVLRINSIGNIQLIDSETNRGIKRDKQLKDWIEYIPDQNSKKYLERHLIPEDKSLWTSDRFDDFLKARLRKIADKIKSQL